MAHNSLRIAANSKRMVSFVIDDMVVSLLLLAIFWTPIEKIIADAPSFGVMAATIIVFVTQNILVVFGVKIIYHTVPVWQSGMTVGKYAMRIKTVDEESAALPTLMQALGRALTRVVSEMTFYIGFVFAFYSPLHQTLHDKLSSCVVVNAD